MRPTLPVQEFYGGSRIPVSRGGGGHIDNLHLLCSMCSSLKGDMDNAYLTKRLKEDGITPLLNADKRKRP